MKIAMSRRIAAGILLSFTVMAIQACGGSGGGSSGGGASGGAASSSSSSSSASVTGYTANSETVLVSDSTNFIFPSYPSIAGLSNGNYVVTWEGSSVSGFRIVDSTGAPVTSEIHLGGINSGAGNFDFHPVVAPLANGGFVIASLEYSGGVYVIKGQRYDASGNAVGSQATVGQINNPVAPLYIRPLASGGYVVVWADIPSGPGQFDIHAQIYDASGNAPGSAFILKSFTLIGNSTTGAYQAPPAFDVAGLASGGMVLVWDAYNAPLVTGWRDVFAQRFDAAGTAQGSQIAVSDSSNLARVPKVSPLASGGFVVAWESTASISGTTFPSLIRTRIFSATGVAQGNETAISDPTLGSNGLVAGLTTGGYTALWTGAPNMAVQGFTSSGAKIGTALPVVNLVANEQAAYPTVAAGLNGNFAVAWYSTILTFGNGASIKVRTYTAQMSH
jgi:hypothetical protein